MLQEERKEKFLIAGESVFWDGVRRKCQARMVEGIGRVGAVKDQQAAGSVGKAERPLLDSGKQLLVLKN